MQANIKPLHATMIPGTGSKFHIFHINLKEMKHKRYIRKMNSMLNIVSYQTTHEITFKFLLCS